MIDIAQALLADIEPNYKQEKKENLSLGKPSKPKTTFLSPPADLRQKTR
jgi:hypothetical protein